MSNDVSISRNNMIDLYDNLSEIQRDIKSINKNSKKSIMSIESLKEEININREQSFILKKELEQKKFNEVKIYKKILVLLDQIDSIYKFAEKIKNNDFIETLSIIEKIITKEMTEINLVEIRAKGELFNSDIHKCIGIEEDDLREYNEIISVIERGYTLNGKVLRPASVIISKKNKEGI